MTVTPREVLTLRRGLRSGAVIRMRIEGAELRVEVEPDSRLSGLLALFVLLSAALGGAAASLGWGASFTPRYLIFMERLGIIGAVVAGVVAALVTYGLLHRFAIDSDADALATELHSRLERALLGMLASE